jgi:hypothetical protein
MKPSSIEKQSRVYSVAYFVILGVAAVLAQLFLAWVTR